MPLTRKRKNTNGTKRTKKKWGLPWRKKKG